MEEMLREKFIALHIYNGKEKLNVRRDIDKIENGKNNNRETQLSPKLRA